MGLNHDEQSFFDARTFERYATKLQNKEDKAHRNASKISSKLSYTREDYGKKTDVKKMLDKAHKQEKNTRSRVRLESKTYDSVSAELDEMTGAREKDTGTEAIEMTDTYAKKYAEHLADMAFMPDSVYQSQSVSKLERKQITQSELHRKQESMSMPQFYGNLNQNESTVLHGFDKEKNARLEALKTKRERINQTGKRIYVNDIVKGTEKDQAIIHKKMQKRHYRRQYSKAVYATGASKKTQLMRDKFLNLTSRRREKEMINKLLSIGIGTALMLVVGLIIMFMAGYVVYMLLADSTYSTNWLTITAVTDYFTKTETEYCPDILATKAQELAQADEFHWYFSDGKTKIEVADEKALVDKWCEVGQISQLKIVSFISTFYRDYELADCQDLLDTLLSRIYSLQIEIVEEPSGEGELCSCGCNSDPPIECTCGDCDGTLDPEMIKVQYVTFTQRDIDEVVEELYAEMAGSEADNLKRYYELYQVTRGSNISLANPLPNHYFKHISSNNGYRIRTDKNYEIEYHKGLDIAAPDGLVLFAPTDCSITEIGYSDSMGNYVIMETEDGMQIRYMHCCSILCEAGDKRKRSYRVARVGSTGDSTGPHLHMDIRVKDEHGNYVYVNPLFAVSDNLQWSFTEAGSRGGFEE